MDHQHRDRVFIGFEADRNDLGGGNRVNWLCAEILRAEFEEVPSASGAVLQAHSFNWKAPAPPRRLFIDHGSFADAGFWAFVAPGLRASDTIIVSSSVCAQVAGKIIEAGGPLILTVPFPVDLGLFAPADDRGSTRRAMAEATGVPSDGPWLLVVSGFVRRKNHHLAVLFLRALQKEIPEARLLVVGATPRHPSSLAYREAVEDLARASGMDPRVHFLGHLPHSRLSGLMAAADLLLHFTNCRLENFGLVVAEAMAAGLPVIAADWGGLRDLVIPGQTGFLAGTYLTPLGPRTDWQSAVRPARDLLRNHAAWVGFSRNSREQAEKSLGEVTFRQHFAAAVTGAMKREIMEDVGPTFTPEGTELRMRTISLNALHPEIKDAGDEFRLLMRTDEGRHYRLLAGPAASSVRPPRIGRLSRLYPVVTWREASGAIRIEDPAWPGVVAADRVRLAVLRSSDGTKTLEEALRAAGAPAGTSCDDTLRAAQALVDGGVLCPIGDGGEERD